MSGSDDRRVKFSVKDLCISYHWPRTTNSNLVQ